MPRRRTRMMSWVKIIVRAVLIVRKEFYVGQCTMVKFCRDHRYIVLSAIYNVNTTYRGFSSCDDVFKVREWQFVVGSVINKTESATDGV